MRPLPLIFHSRAACRWSYDRISLPPAVTNSVRTLFFHMKGVDQLDLSLRSTREASIPVTLFRATRNDDLRCHIDIDMIVE